MAAGPMSRPLQFVGSACAALLVALLAFAPTAFAQQRYTEAEVKAAFLYRFTGYIEWPPQALDRSTFTVAVLGSTQVATELERLLPGRSVKDLPARVKRIRRLSELGDAQMLYVAESYRDIRQVMHALGTKPVLVVTDHPRGLEEGGIVNFLTVDRRVRFEISVAAAQRAQVKIGAELLSLAARVQGAPDRADVPCPPCTHQNDALCSERVAGL